MLRVMRASAPFTSGRCNLSCTGIGRVCGVVGARRWLCGGFGLSPLLGFAWQLAVFPTAVGFYFGGQVLGCLFLVLLVLFFFFC